MKTIDRFMRQILAAALTFALCVGLCLPAHAAVTDTHYTVVSGGMSHTIALKDDGTVWAWGANSSGQLGPGAGEGGSATPIQVQGIESVVSVAAGFHFSAALKFDGTVAVWGSGLYTVPVIVPQLTGVSAIAAGQTDLLALKLDGTVWQWSVGSTAAKQVKGLSQIAAVSVGGGHCLALDHMGNVWAWGSNNTYGQLGLGSVSGQSTPRRIPNLSDIVDISAGYSHSLAVDYYGTVYAWGSNTYGQLGDGTTTNSLVPIEVSTIQNAAQVSAGQDFSMALTEDGKLYTWGYGEFGQLASSTTVTSRTTPETVLASGFGTPVSIACGANHGLLANSRGQIYAWGRNRDGQLGTSKNTSNNVPQNVFALTNQSSYQPDCYQVSILTGLHAWATEELATLHKAGMLSPQVWGDYSRNITRGEFAHLIVNVYEHVQRTSAVPSTTAQFADIQGHPQEQDILKAYQLGLLNGRSDTEFAPNAPVTREQAAKLLCELVSRLQRLTIPTKVSSMAYYADAYQISGWAVHYVAFAHDQAIMQGTGTGFDPKGNMTREQALVTVSRLMTRYGWAR